MSRHGLTGIGQIIKANTTEKSIDDLRAEGKKKVRVVSSERVMAIIQAIVDDTIASEVGEITQRDRDRIVSDTQARFSHVLKMQQDSEEVIAELRASLNSAGLERDRLRGEKQLLEAQLEAAQKVDGQGADLERVSRDVARVRATVERMAESSANSVDEAALGRLAEKLSAQDAQTARRHGADLEDLRERFGHLVRDVAASRDAAIETSLQRSRELIAETEAPVQARIDRDLRSFAERLTEIREKVGHAPAAEEAVARLRGDLAAFAEGIAAQSATAPAIVTEALADLRSHASASAAHTAEVHAGLSTRLDSSLSDLRGHIESLNARSAESAERQQEAIRVLGELIARSTTAQSDSLQTSFKDALERALDKIEKTMQAATARPIEMTGEATDVLLSKIFDDPDSLLTSNFDQLDVEQRRSSGSIAKSVGRLKEMGGAKKAKTEQRAR